MRGKRFVGSHSRLDIAHRRPTHIEDSVGRASVICPILLDFPKNILESTDYGLTRFEAGTAGALNLGLTAIAGDHLSDADEFRALRKRIYERSGAYK